jgi:hypothetical protein
VSAGCRLCARGEGVSPELPDSLQLAEPAEPAALQVADGPEGGQPLPRDAVGQGQVHIPSPYVNKYLCSSLRYPCIFGNCRQSTRFRDAVWTKGANSTIEEKRANNIRWLEETDGDRDQLKDYFNSEFLPLVATNPDGPTLVIEVFPIAELHTLLLNPVNHLVKGLEETCKAEEVGEDVVEGWLKNINVKRAAYQGKNFEGEGFKILPV